MELFIQIISTVWLHCACILLSDFLEILHNTFCMFRDHGIVRTISFVNNDCYYKYYYYYLKNYVHLHTVRE